MKTKYDFDMPDKFIDSDVNRLTNQLWKLIPMRENEENWLGQLETVLIELIGFREVLMIDSKFLILLTKIEGLRIGSNDFFYYRKTVFECISLLREIYNEHKQQKTF